MNYGGYAGVGGYRATAGFGGAKDDNYARSTTIDVAPTYFTDEDLGWTSASTTKPPKSGTPFWTTANQLVESFGPLVTSIVGEVTAGRRNTLAWLSGEIAKKEQQLLVTTDPVKRARLQAEIKALKQQREQYNIAVDTSMQTLQNQAAGAPVVSTAPTDLSSWLPWILLGSAGVLAAVVIAKAAGGDEKKVGVR